jgi:hypothetical protein
MIELTLKMSNRSVEEIMYKMLLAGLAFVAVMTSCGGAMTNTYKTTLSGANEVPPVTTVPAATGAVTATLDVSTKVLTVTGTYTGLSGPIVAPGAHIHGPALVTENKPVLFSLTFTPTNATTTTSGTLSGSFTLTDAQITEINDGKYYVNLHTTANNGGEIRGQLAKQ